VQVSDIGSALDVNFLPVILGFIASVIAGYMAIKWMLDLIKNRSLDIFAFYCWIVGIVVFIGSVAHIF
jgi:undecaprenyl-diphosphatase